MSLIRTSNKKFSHQHSRSISFPYFNPLSIFIFYILYFPVHNKINALCDNQVYIKKLTWLLDDEYNQQGIHKNTEAEALSIILRLLQSNITIEHVKSHQDDKIQYKDLDIKAQLSIDADSIATTTSTILINTNTIALPFVMYIDHKYTHHRLDHYIRVASHKHDVQLFLQYKYIWSLKLFIQLTGIPMLHIFFLFLNLSNNYPYTLSIITSP